jgi:hypothetical protein
MSNPVVRQLAKAALLLAAGTAPVLGAAGQAGAVGQALGPDLPGLTSLDGDSVSRTVDTAAGVTGEAGGEAVRTALPIVAPLAQETTTTTGSAVRTVAPLVSGA